jgi:hypothetical protein
LGAAGRRPVRLTEPGTERRSRNQEVNQPAVDADPETASAIRTEFDVTVDC